jgi:hypothetical protein
MRTDSPPGSELPARALDALPLVRPCIGAALIERAGMDAGRVMREAEEALRAEKAERG